jgi:hypothetical protein
MTDEITLGVAPPLMVGSFVDNGERRFLPSSWNELDRARSATASWLRSFQFPRGSYILSSFTNRDNAHATPFDRGAASIGLIPCSAETGRNEASRFEMIVRRFGVVGVAVATNEVLAGLEELGFAFDQLFQGCVMWLRPDAYSRYHTVPGVMVRRWLDLGPAVSFECAAAEGAHIDAKEWQIGVENGEIILTSRLSRSLHFRQWRSGLLGEVIYGKCRCGSLDPRILPRLG